MPTADELARVQCPFEPTPEYSESPTIPSEHTANIRHVAPRAVFRRSRAPTPADDTTDGEEEVSTQPRSSRTALGRHKPRGTGGDPFTLDDLEELEGHPPKGFKGDRSRTRIFLAQFNIFMRINGDANIAKDPVMRSAYFLSLINGPKVKWWVNHQWDWLERVEADPTILPRRMTAWQALEQEFRSVFFDYAGRERAQQEICRLCMKKGNLDQYIADFERLAYRGGLNVDEPSNLRLFVQGLPSRLVDSCIDFECPETFEQWAKAAQRRQKISFKIQSLRGVFGASQQTNTQRQNNSTRGQFY
jgi:hypothetical protein